MTFAGTSGGDDRAFPRHPGRAPRERRVPVVLRIPRASAGSHPALTAIAGPRFSTVASTWIVPLSCDEQQPLDKPGREDPAAAHGRSSY
jgi:hypothetical protein